MARAAVYGETLQVSGLQSLIRDLGRADKSLRVEIRKEIKEVAAIVSDEARLIAEAKHLHKTGRLIAQIRPGVRGNVGLVRESAQKGGFSYPMIYEYGGARTGEEAVGRRAFLAPAVVGKQEAVVQAFERMLDRITSESGLGRGGIL